MKVIVERAFGRYSVGAVIPEMPENQADILIRRGLVRAAAAPAAVPTPPVYEDRQVTRAPVDRAMRPASRRGKPDAPK